METAANRNRGELIRKFLLQNVDAHPATITSIATKKFKVDERNIRQHIQRLRTQGLLLAEGKTRDRVYKLRVLKEWNKMYPIAPGTTEDAAWREISPEIGRLPKDVMDIWDRGFTEMFNNALDHSGGTEIDVRFRKTAINTELALYDNGVGIFKKIQNALNLPDQREAIFELSKGKFTTDPTKHSGEGIFFTSRLFDSYDILSGGLAFMREAGHDEHWVLDRNRFENGTAVWMKIADDSRRTCEEVYAKYSIDDFNFDKTVVSLLKMAQYETGGLVSRSQAKRVLARVDKFKMVVIDFTGVANIGQAFADEIFRVYPTTHPGTEIVANSANPEVAAMIQRAKAISTT